MTIDLFWQICLILVLLPLAFAVGCGIYASRAWSREIYRVENKD